MFNQLFETASAAKQLNMRIIANPENGTLFISVEPQAKDGDHSALSEPFWLRGTPEELDQNFLAQFDEYNAARQGLISSLNDSKAIIDAAAKEARGKAASAMKKTQKPAPKAPSASSTGGSNGEDDDEKLETHSTAAVGSNTTESGAGIGDGSPNLF
jgi:PRTRC genetic system protein E